MRNIPQKIYLQIDADGDTPEDFNTLVGVSWCPDKINPNDIEYVLSNDTYKKAIAQIKDICTDYETPGIEALQILQLLKELSL